MSDQSGGEVGVGRSPSWWHRSSRPRPAAGVRSLWLSSASSAASLWMVQIAIAVHVLADHSVATLAVVTLIGNVPALVSTPFAGLLADRLDVALLARWAMAGQVASLAMLLISFTSSIGVLAAAYALQGMLASYWPPARQQWLYGLVDPGRRQQANASIGSITGLMTLVGAAFGGVLSGWSPIAAVGCAAVCQVAAVSQLLFVPRPRADHGFGRPSASLRQGLSEGVRAAAAYPLARSVVWIGIAWGFIGGGYTVLLAGHVTRDLEGSPAALGVVLAMDGASVIVATVLASRARRSRHLVIYACAYVLQGLAAAAVFASATWAILLTFLVVMRLASGFIIALDMSILLDTVPEQLRGRITSLHLTTFNAVGRLALGVLSGVLTVSSIPTIGVTVGLLSALFGLCWWWLAGRRARDLYLSATVIPT